jgi:hypothetical protein
MFRKLFSPESSVSSRPNWLSKIFILSLLVLAFGLLVHPMGDPDVYIHLRDGRFWVESGWQIENEPFAYTVPEKPMEKVECLFRIGLYQAWKIGGNNFLILIKALAMTAALFLIGLLIYRRWAHLGITSILLGLAVLAPMHRIFPERPYIFTYLLLPLSLLWLDDYCRADPVNEPAARKKLWLIPALVIPWVNLHPGFVVIFGFFGVRLLDEALSYWRIQNQQVLRRMLTISAVSAACFLAGAVNPMGFSIYSFIIHMMGSSEFMRYIIEWAPPKLAQQPVFFFLLGLAWLLQLLALRRTRLSDMLLLTVFSYLAVKSYRNIPLFLIAALPPLAGHWQYVWKEWFPSLRMTVSLRRISLLAGSLGTAGLLATASITGYAFRLGEIPRFYPANGLAWLQAHPLKGRLLTHDIWGGYTGWATHGETKIFMDGRLPTFGEKLYANYRKMIWGDPQWCLPLLDRFKIEGILVSPKNDIKLFQQLWKSGTWPLVYWDDVCLLYIRRSETNRTLVNQFEYRAVDPKRSPYFDPEKPELALQEIRRAVQTAPDSFLPHYFEGEMNMQKGELRKANQSFQQALALAPGHVATHYNLGHLAYREKKFDQAEQHFRTALRILRPGTMYAKTCFFLGLTQSQDPMRRNEALRWAKKALKFLPDWKPAQDLVRQLSL